MSRGRVLTAGDPAPGRWHPPLPDRSHAVDRTQHALQLVVGGERRGLVPIGQYPSPQTSGLSSGAELAARLHVGDALSMR